MTASFSWDLIPSISAALCCLPFVSCWPKIDDRIAMRKFISNANQQQKRHVKMPKKKWKTKRKKEKKEMISLLFK